MDLEIQEIVLRQNSSRFSAFFTGCKARAEARRVGMAGIFFIKRMESKMDGPTPETVGDVNFESQLSIHFFFFAKRWSLSMSIQF